jgi:hypothetical protein
LTWNCPIDVELPAHRTPLDSGAPLLRPRSAAQFLPGFCGTCARAGGELAHCADESFDLTAAPAAARSSGHFRGVDRRAVGVRVPGDDRRGRSTSAALSVPIDRVEARAFA